MKSAMMLLCALIVAPQLAFATNAAGLAYLEENKGKDGVVTLPCAAVHAHTATQAPRPPARLPPPSSSAPPRRSPQHPARCRLRRSGLQYKVLTAAPAGAKSPKAGTPCECHYRGTLIDGTEFDSSYKRGQPATFAPNQVVKGWTEAMQLMKEGGKWELYIPSELGYGDRGAGASIPGGAVLVFTLELLSVEGAAKEE